MAARRSDDTAARRLEQRIAFRLGLARAAIGWERVWLALWPLPALVGAFLAAALLELPQSLPVPLHVALLAVLALIAAAIVVRAVRRVRWPDREAAERRVEAASGLRHRPLQVLRDRPAAADAAGLALWRIHMARTAARLSRLRSGWPRAGFTARDPAALRAAAALALVVGIVVAGETAPARLLAAVRPGIGPLGSGPPVVDLWIEPPAYTGAAPIYGKAGQGTLVFPAGSIVAARVRGAGRAPTLAVDAAAVPFAPVEARTWEVRHPVSDGKALAVRQGDETLASWPIRVIPDNPPTAKLTRPPAATQRAALRVDYAAEDDYGLASAAIEIRRTDAPALPPLVLPLLNGEGQPRRIQATEYRDLAPHPWAGHPVELRIVAKDAAGQTGASDPVRFVLPERTFQHPVARLIIATRKLLEPEPEAEEEVERRLAGIQALTPLYGDDTTVFLGLSSARARLRFDGSEQAVEDVRTLLWDLAVRLDEGNLSLAERELRAAQRALADAIERNAPQDEIDRALRRLQEAINRYMQEMLARAERNPQEAQEVPPDARTIDQRDIADMMRRLRDAMRSGDRQAAQRAMAELQQMLEALRNARVARGDPRQRGMSQMMRRFDGLAERQRRLLDQTFRQQQQQGEPGQGGQPGQPSADDLRAAQDALRRELGEMMRQLGEQRNGSIPGGLGRAEQAMRNAIDALGRGRPGDAVGPQSDALDQLRQAGREMAREMARQMGPGDPGEGDPRDQGERPQRDPLGRTGGGYATDTGDVDIPTQSEFQRAREIRDELQRRAGERSRPAGEREYLERLLKSF